MQNRESLFKYQSNIYSVQSNSDVNHIGMKIICDNKRFPLLNIINGESSSYGSTGVIRHYHYR